MTALAAKVSSASASQSTVEAMLAVVKDSGTDVRVCTVGSHVLGVAANPELPGQATLATEDGWAAALVGVLDNSADFSGDNPALKVLRILRGEGPTALSRLRGAFAIVVSDGRRAWCARDQIGLEPLFYKRTARELLIGSEVKQVVAGSSGPSEPDLETVYAIFYGDPYDEARTAFAGVDRLPKGSYLEWDGADARILRYWDPRPLLESAMLNPGEIKEQFDHLFTRAIGRVLTGHDALSLSGGVDSTAIAAYGASQHLALGGRRLAAISSVYPDQPSVDESAVIKSLADDLDLDLHTYVPEPLRLDRLQEWVRAFDGPWSAWHPGASEQTYRQMKSLGFSNMFTGEFAEQVTDVNRGVLPHLLGAGRIGAALVTRRQLLGQGVSGKTIIRQVASTVVPRAIAASRRYRNPLAVIPPWMDAERIRKWQAAATVAPRRVWRKGQIGFLDIATSSLGAYRMLQARNGVRVRYPFADVDFWEFWLSLPAHVKHPNGRSKTLLRQLLRGRVPDAVLDGPKIVFNDYVTHRIDYPSLRKWLVEPSVRIDGINYELLSDRLDAEQLGMSEFMWAKDLAAAHAFLGLWGN